ncbi:MAG: EamA family transporter [Desulfatiglandaceae bacterium]|jgi:drug/metabolite transporter (DMT)-like permease
MNNLFLYVFTVLIWGSTWLAIKFQIGHVDPMLSVSYRFALAAFLLGCYCRISGLKMRFHLREHLLMGSQGLLLFSFGYWFVYLSEIHLTSGLVAVIFATMLFMNIINSSLFLGQKIEGLMMIGAVVGLIGLGLVFRPEIASFQLSNQGLRGLLLGLAGSYLSSLGNILSAYTQKRRIPVMQNNVYGMAYGSILLFVVSLLMGKTINFALTPGYIGSLIYLAVLGSIVAFGCYLTLLGRIGADKAAYVTLIIPIVALGISTIFEGYHWTGEAFVGMALVLAGNFLVLRRRQASQTARSGSGRLVFSKR